MDERAIFHRYKASRWALIVGTVIMGGFILYDYISKDLFRWDLFIILLAMAVVKIAVRIYYMKKG